ncbi:MAG TPA: hypothetical protein VFW73_06490, partial [Lacipirellulaceae bacterium]|nr:hypothetical protein [Lacipirellulaceae bacterium]
HQQWLQATNLFGIHALISGRALDSPNFRRYLRGWQDQVSAVVLKRGRGHSLAVFLDNLDRRQDPIQEEAFLRASAMARDWGGLVFVCLRPSTFFRSRTEGVLDAVAPKTITIVSPKTSVLLKKRFQYAQRFARGETVIRRQSLRGPMGQNVTLDLPRVAELLECFGESFFRERKLTTLFEAVSNGNVRDLLRYVKSVITSKHLNTEKILARIHRRYRVPDHEALRALLYGDFWHYDPGKSIFLNMFDIVRADPAEHFSRLLTLQYLARVNDGPRNSGFTGLTEISQYLCQLGYSGQHARETVEVLYGRKCCEGRVSGVEWANLGSELRVTSLGKYHVMQLVKTFEYFDAIVVDTPILDPAIRMAISDERAISHRLQRGRLLLDYLNNCSAAIQDADAVAIWQEIYHEVSGDISRIAAAIES